MVEIQISTPMIATPVRAAVVVFVDLLKKLSSLFFYIVLLTTLGSCETYFFGWLKLKRLMELMIFCVNFCILMLS